MCNRLNIAFSLNPHLCAARQGRVGPVNHFGRTADNSLVAIGVVLPLFDCDARFALPGFLVAADDVLVDMNTTKHDATLSPVALQGFQMRQTYQNPRWRN